jgi:hypothetical protein
MSKMARPAETAATLVRLRIVKNWLPVMLVSSRPLDKAKREAYLVTTELRVVALRQLRGL